MAKNVLAKAQRRKVPLIEIHNSEPYEILHLAYAQGARHNTNQLKPDLAGIQVA